MDQGFSKSYVGLVTLMFFENIFPPLPSELIMPTAGFWVSRGDLSFIAAVMAGTAGSLLGAVTLYYAGHVLGFDRLRRGVDSYGRWLGVSGSDVERAKLWFDHHGEKAVFLGRLVPGVRSVISIPAGVSGMAMPTFLLYSGLGSGLWAGVLAYLGMLLGENYDTVADWLGPVGPAVVAVLCLFAGGWLLVRYLRAR